MKKINRSFNLGYSLLTDSYSPTETYFITENSKCKFLDILALVICELLSKEILEVEYKQIQKSLEAYAFRKGANFQTASKTPIDKLITRFFSESNHTNIQAKQLFYYAIENASNKNNLVRIGLKSSRLSKLARFKNLFSILGKISLNKNGRIALNTIKAELVEIKSRLELAINQENLDHEEILSLIKHRYFYFQEYRIDQIFGRDYGTYLKQFKLTGYDIQHELNFGYFREKLKLAHIELLKLEFMDKKYEEYVTEKHFDYMIYHD